MPAAATPRPWVLHVDLDQFIAAVEVLRRPELAGLPVIVGGRGDPTERAVVSTASYEARAFGVGSGMPLRVAARKAPTAIILPVDREAYDEASGRVMEALRSLGVPVEVLGWDEAFLGVDASDPQEFAGRVRATVLEATGLHASVGIGDNTVRAKIATGFGKPRGVFRLTRENWFAVMGERPVIDLWGVGTKVSGRLAKLGIRTVRELADADPAAVVAEFGPRMGRWYHGLGSGDGRAEVDDSPWIARGHSRETTYQQNLVTAEEVSDAVRALAVEVAGDVQAEGRAAFRVALKVRYAPFSTTTIARKLPAPTLSTDDVVAAALALAATLDPEREVRLLGVRAEMLMPEGCDTVERTPIRGRM